MLEISMLKQVSWGKHLGKLSGFEFKPQLFDMSTHTYPCNRVLTQHLHVDGSSSLGVSFTNGYSTSRMH